MKASLLCLLLLFGAGRAEEKADNTDTVSVEAPASPELAVPPEKGGPRPDSEHWMDRSNVWVTEALYQQVYRLDSMFYGADQVRREDPRSRFRLRLFGIVDPDDPGGFKLDANTSASVRLPGLKDRFRLVLDSEELDRFPDATPDQRSDRPQVALRRVGRRLDADVGAKLKTPPNAFVRFNFRRGWEMGDWDWGFSQRFFYDTQEGFGELTSLSQHRWLGSHWMLGHSSSLRWSESTEGLEWQDSLSFYRVLSLIEIDKVGRFVGTGDLSSGVGIRFGANGHHNGSGNMDSYKLSWIYRHPVMRRDFIYLEVIPEVEWKEDNEWEPVYTLRVGLDILFWRDR